MIDKPIRVIELFAGYGSQALALKYAGIPYENHFVCEFDKYAIQSYNDIHNTKFGTTDIRYIHAKDLNITETDKYKYLLTYSFPCTDLSVAGRRAGMSRNSGTRSSLLWEVERLLSECEELPQYLLMENVPQVADNSNIQLFGEWIDFLASIGYDSYYKVLNAKDFGVPQNRERCFMVSILKSEHKDFIFPTGRPLTKRLKDLLEEEQFVDEKCFCTTKNAMQLIDTLVTKNNLDYFKKMNMITPKVFDVICVGFVEKGTGKHQSNSVYSTNGVSPTLATQQDTWILVDTNKGTSYGIRKLTPKECFRLMGVRDEDYCKVTVSNRQKKKQAGNSIVVDVMMDIFTNLFVKECKNNVLF